MYTLCTGQLNHTGSLDHLQITQFLFRSIVLNIARCTLHISLHFNSISLHCLHLMFYILGQLYGAYRRPMDAIFFFAFRPITWDFVVVTYLLGTTMWNLSSWQSPKKFGFPSTPSCPAWTEKSKNSLLKYPITVGCQSKNPQLTRSSNSMTITHRTRVGKAIIGKGQVIVSFAELDLQLVIQHCCGTYW